MDKITINWATATDAEKNACFAEHVSHWTRGKTYHDLNGEYYENGRNPPDYLHSADAVLPWLEKLRDGFEISYPTSDNEYIVTACDVERGGQTICRKSFPEAAMICLLRANGVEVIT